jgi:prevent-host-death family protein
MIEPTMTIVNVHDAKTRLSQLLLAVESGEVVVIARNGSPVASLIPYAAPRPSRVLGCAEGSVVYMASDFDEPLSDFSDYMPQDA